MINKDYPNLQVFSGQDCVFAIWTLNTKLIMLNLRTNVLCSLQREKDGLRQKQKEVDAMASRHAKERQRIKQVQIKDFHQLFGFN